MLAPLDPVTKYFFPWILLSFYIDVRNLFDLVSF